MSVIINNISFRIPNKKSLLEILKKTGPLVAPSANPEGLNPAENIEQAKVYFGPARNAFSLADAGGDKVDFYLSGGTLKSEASTLVSLDKKGEITILRGILKK